MKNKKWYKIVKKLYLKFIADDITALGAQVAYYLLISFFPLLIFIASIISYTNVVTEDSLAILSGFMPASVYMLILDIVRNVLQSRNKAFISISMIVTIWTASSGVLAFMYGMNRAYKRKETRPFWLVRGLSILFTLALSIIIFLSIIFVVFGRMIERYITRILGPAYIFEKVWDIFRYGISIFTLIIVFILFYRFIPNYHLKIRDVIPGALLSTLGWLLLSAGFAFYVNNFMNFSRTYGSIGAAIALLIWLYWSSIIIFVGSELNAVISKEREKK